jgi:threonine dehydrogenase-like Zn-dependent dehydrogenase
LKAAFFKLPGQVELREVDDLHPQAGQVLIRILASGICGSDDYAYRTGKELGGLVRGVWHRRGHEYAGRVVEVGPAVTSLRPGDMVAGIGSLPCGKCPSCVRGAPAYCTSSRWCEGEGFCEYLCKEEEWFYPIPDLTAEQAALIEPLTVAMEMVNDAGVRAGGNVLLLGAGPIGLMAISACRRAGAKRVYVSHPSHSRARLAAAAALGADRVFLSDRDDVVARIKQEHPQGLDAVLVTIRPSLGVSQAAAVCGLGGRISLVGMANEATDTITLDVDSFHFKKLSLVGSNHNPCGRLYPGAAEMLRRGEVDAGKIITHRFPLEQIREAFKFATVERGKVVKVIITQGEHGE